MAEVVVTRLGEAYSTRPGTGAAKPLAAKGKGKARSEAKHYG